MIGKTLNHYQIESQLGAGGMGEVYQARDTRLGRSVAVKVLPEAFARDPDRAARFEREARMLAALNHPNIAALYGLEQAGERHFLVMELVEGETLAARLRRGPLPVEDALRVANQIAEALEAAHAKGVVHRDLKPANVKVTPEGKVKVLDFGLAKAMENAPPNANLSNSPTLSMAATNAGVILGTASYMSPEQAKGLAADARSDIFSFGCVLYEMLAGRQPFQGETTSEIIASVLVREPDWAVLPGNIKPRIHELVRRCLDKNPKRRWQVAADVRLEIEALLSDPTGTLALPMEGTKPRPLWKRAIPVLITAVVVGVATSISVWNLKPSPPTSVTRLSYPLPEGQTLTIGTAQLIAISRDGTRMVYSANQQQVFLRLMSEMEARPIFNSPVNIASLFFSPDGEWVGFYSLNDQMLKKVAVTGGAAIPICQAAFFGGAYWEGDQIIFAERRGILRVSANGGEPEVLVKVSGTELAYGPKLLDGGRAVLFTIINGATAADFDQGQIVVQPLPSGDRKIILRGGSDARYVPTGHIVYSFGQTVRALPFDSNALDVKGTSTPILDSVLRSPVGITPATQLDFAANGTLIYMPGSSSATERRSLALVDRSGKAQTLPLPPAMYGHPRFSPDGKRLVFETTDAADQMVSIYDLSAGTSARRLTIGGRSTHPIWSRDGRSVIFTSESKGALNLFRQLADGTGAAEELMTKTETVGARVPQSLDPMGKVLAFVEYRNGVPAIWTKLLEGDPKATRFSEPGNYNQMQAEFSPDGRLLAYLSTKLGTPQIFVKAYPSGAGSEYQVTTEGAGFPVWSPDGKQLFYMVDPTNPKMNVVDVITQPAFSFGKPTTLPITATIHPIPGFRNYDISPDGKHFVFVTPASENQSAAKPVRPQINVVMNWFEELKQRAR